MLQSLESDSAGFNLICFFQTRLLLKMSARDATESKWLFCKLL